MKEIDNYWEEKIQKIVDGMKEPLQEFWTNELGLPMWAQLKSMAIMDLYIHKLLS